MTDARQPIAFVTKEIVLLMLSTMLSKGEVTSRPARNICLKCVPL